MHRRKAVSETHEEFRRRTGMRGFEALQMWVAMKLKVVAATTVQNLLRLWKGFEKRKDHPEPWLKDQKMKDLEKSIRRLAARHTPTKTATPMSWPQFKDLVSGGDLTPVAKTVAVIMWQGAARLKELKDPKTSLKKTGRVGVYNLERVPKGQEAPRTSTVISVGKWAIINTGHVPLKRLTLAEFNAMLKVAAKHYGWGEGRWSSYSLRRGGMQHAQRNGVTEEELREQTGHKTKVPRTYLLDLERSERQAKIARTMMTMNGV